VALPPTSIALLALTGLVLAVLAPQPSHADELQLVSIGVRARFGGQQVLGNPQPETFQEYDVVAAIQLPWKKYAQSGATWAGARLLASAGVLNGTDKSALVISVIPVLALGTQGGAVTLDVGAGAALLSRHQFGRQDFGGPFQFALTFGVAVPLYKRFGVGYRFQHYSDAGIYGSGTTGADFHMVELTYRF
jgi:hypothetical protein